MSEPRFEDLVGKTLVEVAGKVGDESIRFVTTDGEIYELLHIEDCCESVRVEDIVGDLAALVGSPILTARETCDGGKATADGSETWTFYDLATALGHVTIRWYGSSNGHYAEGVDFRRVPN